MSAQAASVNPADIARIAIRQLAASRIAPTPENFARAYRDAAGGGAPVVDAEQVLGRMIEGIASRRPDLGNVLRLQEQVARRTWGAALEGVDEAVAKALPDASREWPRLVQQLLILLDTSHAEWTRARKLGALRHILLTPSADERTREKLEGLMAAWTGHAEHHDATPAAPAAPASAAGAAPEAALAVPAAALPETAAAHPEVRRQAALAERLVRLLRMVCANLTLFADDDAWIRGQVARLGKLLDAPLDARVLDEAEESLRKAIERQAAVKADLDVAKAAIRNMLASLLDRLDKAAASTGDFHRRIGERATAIKLADDLPSLSRVVADLLDDAVAMREGMAQSHDELRGALETARQQEARVQALERELVDVSSLVRLDPLTQVLNRRGLEEVFAIEQARAERTARGLAVALLDIDNFKLLNDALGHHAGDLALKHLCAMVRAAVRPTDSVARYGGEEFVILLPGTTAEEAAEILVRAQRQLTRELFLHNGKKVLITFSAGATESIPGEAQETAIRRADTALYAAKAAGKNRVQIG